MFMKGEGLTAGAEGLFILGTGGRLFSIFMAHVSQQHLERGRMGHWKSSKDADDAGAGRS